MVKSTRMGTYDLENVRIMCAVAVVPLYIILNDSRQVSYSVKIFIEPGQNVIFHVICEMITNVWIPPFNTSNDLAFNLQFLLHLLHLEPILSGCQSLCPPQLITKPSCFSAMFAEGVREPFN